MQNKLQDRPGEHTMRQMSTEGILFNIQKFSINDGPGIRTTVFLKGCPLRCRWCANPESQSPRIQLLWNSQQCRHCHHCIAICPEQALTLRMDSIRLDDAKCSGCQKCAAECPATAISIEGEKKSVKEILQICLQDRDFYEESGGGVTLSGGEVLRSSAFAIALLQSLQGAGIHTAIETSGYASATVFAEVTQYADLLIFDMKHWDCERHIEGTGVSNELPLLNMKTAIAGGQKVLPRIPVIPGYNDQPADALGFSRRLKEVGAATVQLLPFHQFGQNKYHLLGQEYAYDNIPALHKEDLIDYRQTFLQQGIQAFF